MAKRILTALMAVFLSACGGGGSNAPLPISVCVPKAVVSVQLFGDSTMLGSGATDPAFTPTGLLQAALDARFGAGTTVVWDYARGGTTTADALAGTDYMDVWPSDVKGDIVVANWGVNDSAVPIDLGTYQSNLAALKGVTLFETPNPIIPGKGDDSGYAQAMRDTAASKNIPVADTQAYVLTLPNWQVLYADGFHHPDDALYRLIVANSLAPAVAKQVAALKCQV